MTKTFVKQSRVINDNFTEVPNSLESQYNRDMSRTYQVNQTTGGVGHSTTSIDGNWGVQTSQVQLCDDDDDDNDRKSKLRRCLGIGFLTILMLSAITFMVLAIFYDEILDKDNENSEQYWDRIQKEIRLAHNVAKMNELNRTLYIKAKNEYKLNKTRRNNSKPGITYEEFTSGTFNTESYTSKWISNNELLYYDKQSNLCITNVTDMTKKIIVSRKNILKQKIFAESLSADRKYLLVVSKKKKVYRHSSLGVYRIYSIKNGKLSKGITPKNKPKEDRLNFAEWGPVGSQLIFIQDNNIYYKSSAFSDPIQLTKTGKDKTIYNGVPDWVYEEEIFAGPKAFWLSPDGKGLVYATINDTQVDLMTWPWYGIRTSKGTLNQYTEIKSIRYPKPGRPNPTVSLSYIPVSELNDDTKPDDITIPLKPPKAISDLGEYLFTAFKWIDDYWFAINWMNRTQNFAVMVIYGIENDLKPITSFSLMSNNSWIDLFSPPLITPDGSSFLITSPQVSDNKRDTFPHIRRITVQITNESESQFLTSGVFEVKKILDINIETQRVYFMATFPSNPGSKHLLSVPLNKSANRSEPICHTCLFNTTVDNNGEQSCLTSEINFSFGADYYIIECQGPGAPQIAIRRTSDHKLVHVLEDNRVLKSHLKNKSLPKRVFKKVSVGDHFVDVMLLVPQDFDEKAQLKYPIVFNVYGGPRHESVTQTYYYNQFGSFLVSNRSVIYAMLDSRGSANHGYKFMIDIYHNFGQAEVEDTVAVAEYFRNQSYVDRNSVSIWGWSYGGYVTTMALESDVRYQNKSVFNCGIAVAPVTDWLYYDSVYAERYMGLPTPKGNLANYKRSSTIQRVKHLNGKQFLIIFGTADDNVHAMNSMMLLKAMNEANIKYQTQIYPDNNHGLQNTPVHLYRRMLDFFDDCFQHKS